MKRAVKHRICGFPNSCCLQILENPRGLKDVELKGMLMDTVIATSDTFIAMIEWMLALACQHPEVQRKLQVPPGPPGALPYRRRQCP